MTTTHTIMTPDFNTMTPAQQKRLFELMMRNIKNADIMHAPGFPVMPSAMPRVGITITDIDSLLDDLERQENERAERRERELRERLETMFNREELFRFAYVPFVIAELVWNYAESILDLVSYMKIDAVKGVGRAIRQLRREYEQLRAPYIDAKHRNSELDNMLVFEDGVKDLTSLFLVNLKADLKSEYPDLEDDYHYLLLAVYECLIVIRALFYYASKQRELMAGKVGHPIGDILPPQLRKLETLVQCYIGDKPISEKFQKQHQTYIAALANRMKLIGLNEIK